MKLVILFLAMLIAKPALAITCLNDYGGNNSCVEGRTSEETSGDCKTLGYTDSSCASAQAFLRCPFDETKLRCIEIKETTPACKDIGYISASALGSWCGESKTCYNDSSLKLCLNLKQDICSSAGYTDTECEGTFETCPFNSAYKKCITQTVPKSCEESGYVKKETFDKPIQDWCLDYQTCPTDPSYVACSKLNCEAIGYEKVENLKDWCASMIYCPTDNNYAACQKVDCEKVGFNNDYENSNDVCIGLGIRVFCLGANQPYLCTDLSY